MDNKGLVNRSLVNICLDLIELDIDAPENKDFIDKRIGELGTKVDNYVGAYKFADSQIDLLKSEIEHLKHQVKLFEKVQDKLKDRAMYALDLLNTDSVKSDSGHKIAIRESESVEVDDLTKIPDQFVRTKIVIEPDKISIKYAIKQGESVPGCRMVKNKSVQIK